MTGLTEEIRASLHDLERNHLLRRLTTLEEVSGVRVRIGDRELLNFASNDYLGLAHHSKLKLAAIEMIGKHGVGSGSSRLISGTHAAHRELEEAIADFKGTEAAVAFSSGYATAMGFATALLDKSCIVIVDKLIHACLIDACRLSGATLRVFRHNDMEKLEVLLRWARRRFSAENRVFILTESVFSMDGDLAPLLEIVRLKEAYGAYLLVDEAHAIGVMGPGGRGLAAERGLTQRIEIHMGTLSKAVGVAGGYLAGSARVRELLINRARSFIYSTAPPPAVAATAAAALELIKGKEGDERRRHLASLVDRLRTRLQCQASQSPIIPFIVDDEEAALELAASLDERGFFVPAIRYPTVARGAARLRITLSASHEMEQVDALAAAVLG